MIPHKNSTTPYTARYLVLLGHDNVISRALLFARDQRFLAEVFDEDGLVIENLLKTGTACPPPRKVAAQAWASAPATVRCYALDPQDEGVNEEVGEG
jgi:hypothetical protein